MVLVHNKNELINALRDANGVPVVLFASALDDEARRHLNRQIQIKRTNRIYLVLSESAYDARESLWGDPLRANTSFCFVANPPKRQRPVERVVTNFSHSDDYPGGSFL